MTDLEKVEYITKALQEGKTIESNDKSVSAKLINGILVEFINGNPFGINSGIKIGECKIQEPEPEFEITPNQLAEYECRDGKTLITNGVKKYNTYCGILNDGTSITTLRKCGNTDGSVTVIRKIRDL
jgi:hypothetical protein